MHCLASIQDTMNAFHDGDIALSDETMDELLGIPSESNEPRIALEQSHCIGRKGEQSVYDGTSFETARAFLHFVNPQPSDIVYDLGGGYGRLLLYGAMTTPATYKSFEIVPHRVTMAQKAISRNGLEERAAMRCANIRNVKYDDGTIFFLYNPFSIRTLKIVGEHLKNIAKRRPITIGSLGFSSIYFNKQEWLSPVMRDDKKFLSVYRSQKTSDS